MENRKFVIVQHVCDNGKYLFEVPKGRSVYACEYVLCDTRKGKNQVGVALCDDFSADPEVLCPLFGTTPDDLRKVTARLMTYWSENETDEA